MKLFDYHHLGLVQGISIIFPLLQRKITNTKSFSQRTFMEADLELFGMKSAPKHTDTILYVVPSLVHHNPKYWTNASEYVNFEISKRIRSTC